MNITNTLIENIENFHKTKIGLFNINNNITINVENSTISNNKVHNCGIM